MLDTQLLSWMERTDGPAVVAYHLASPISIEEAVDWHRHVRGQVFCVESGLISARTRSGAWLLPPQCAGWIPPGELHTISISGRFAGWGLLIAPSACDDLPPQPCVLGVNDMMRALVRRAATWNGAERLDTKQARVMDVLLDEMRDAPRKPLHLPMPLDRRLERIARAVLADLQDSRGIEAWANWAGLSPRTMTRRFRHETKLSFAQWRQQARLAHALQLLSEGQAVARVADALGYSSPSAFVAAFRERSAPPRGDIS